MKKCAHCGRENDDNANVCFFCGNAIGTDVKLDAHLRKNRQLIEEMRRAKKIEFKMPKVNRKKIIHAILIVVALLFIVGIVNVIDSGLNSSPSDNIYLTDSIEGAEGYANTSEYILPDSNSRYLSVEDIELLSAEQLRIARNEIYARHGRRFTDASLQAHFDSCSWYSGTIAPEAFTESMLNEYEVANRDLIISYETSKGYR